MDKQKEVEYTDTKDQRSSNPSGFEEADEYWSWILYGEARKQGGQSES